MTKREKIAYCAGIIDSDGCISLGSGRDDREWKLRLTVNMQSERVIDFLIGTFGGRSRRTEKPTAKYAIYYWVISGVKAYKIMKQIKPYLVEKSAQADEAMKFYVHQKNHGARPLTQQEIQKRLRYKIRLRELKTRFLSPKIALAETKCENT